MLPCSEALLLGGITLSQHNNIVLGEMCFLSPSTRLHVPCYGSCQWECMLETPRLLPPRSFSPYGELETLYKAMLILNDALCTTDV